MVEKDIKEIASLSLIEHAKIRKQKGRVILRKMPRHLHKIMRKKQNKSCKIYTATRKSFLV